MAIADARQRNVGVIGAMPIVIERQRKVIVLVDLLGENQIALDIPRIPFAEGFVAGISAAERDAADPIVLFEDPGAEGDGFVAELPGNARGVGVGIEKEKVVANARADLIARQDAEPAGRFVLVETNRLVATMNMPCLKEERIGPTLEELTLVGPRFDQKGRASLRLCR